MKQISGSRLLTLSATLIGARIAGAGLTFLTQILIARWLGADTLGQYAVAMSLGGVLAILAAGGYPSIAQRYISRYRVDQRPDLSAGFTSSGLRNLFLGSAGLIVLTWAGLWLTAGERSPDYSLALAVGALIAPAMAMLNFHGGVCNAFRRPFLGFLPDTLLRPVLFIAVVAVVNLALAASASATELMVMNLGVVIVAAMLQWIVMRREALLPRRRARRAYETAQWRKSALPLVLAVLFTNYFIEIDILLLSTLMAPEQIAVFNICVRFTAFIVFALQSVNQIALPDLADAHARTDGGGVMQALARANFAGVGLAVSATIGLVLLGQPILSMIGPQFAGGYKLLVLLAIAQVARASLGSASVQLLTVTGHQVKVLPSLGVGLAVLIILNFVLVPRFGLEGAGLAMLVSIILWSASLAVVAHRVTGYDVTLWTPLRQLVARHFARTA
ncbi:lipopolysaccharide biosynthesis protein [Rhodoligotrophos defluvii]|uniref:lipopolysaccharide biosynthesis protein n=1 Tax=Rhodoligotrophos defluvii TaxID=2561934 RepID=UPI0010C98790|nr:polysaccharide biosynthesis C-terminal domain-containing protein [Rhodoligotrophos defluvii]